MQPGDDAAVIARVLEGEVEQFAELVHRYQAGLYRYAVAVVGDHDVAADMVQDAFVRAYTNLNACRDRARFRIWLFRTLRNRCFDHLKDPRRKNRPIEDAGTVSDGQAPPDEQIERSRLRTDIRHALDSLPAAQREAFLMHHVEGVPYDEMAELLDASISALKMRVMRARETLAASLRAREVTGTGPVRLFVSGR